MHEGLKSSIAARRSDGNAAQNSALGRCVPRSFWMRSNFIGRSLRSEFETPIRRVTFCNFSELARLVAVGVRHVFVPFLQLTQVNQCRIQVEQICWFVTLPWLDSASLSCVHRFVFGGDSGNTSVSSSFSSAFRYQKLTPLENWKFQI